MRKAIQLKDLRLVAVFFVGLLALQVSTVWAQGYGNGQYEQGVSPTFTVSPNSNGYGGFTGVLVDDILNENGVFTIKSVYPNVTKADSNDGYGVVASGNVFLPPAYNLENDGLAVKDCKVVGANSECTLFWDASLDYDAYGGSDNWPAGKYRVYAVNHAVNSALEDDLSVWYKAGSAPLDHLPIKIVGQVGGPVAAFVNPDAQTVTDPNQQTLTIEVMVRDHEGVDRIELNLGGKSVTVLESTSVSVSDQYGEGTVRFTYDWDIASLDTGIYSVSGTAFAIDGRSTEINSGANLYDDSIQVTLAVDVNEKLQQQCQENQAAVQALINDINDDATERNDALADYVGDVISYINSGETELSGEVVALIEAVQASQAETSQSYNGLSSSVSCEVSLAADVGVYRTGYNTWSEDMAELSENLVELINTYLGDA